MVRPAGVRSPGWRMATLMGVPAALPASIQVREAPGWAAVAAWTSRSNPAALSAGHVAGDSPEPSGIGPAPVSRARVLYAGVCQYNPAAVTPKHIRAIHDQAARALWRCSRIRREEPVRTIERTLPGHQRIMPLSERKISPTALQAAMAAP